MNATRNKIQLIGNIGITPKIEVTDTNKKCARFPVAINETFINNKGEKVTETQWHNVICWGKLAEIAEKYLVKGTEIAIVGKLLQRQFKDSEETLRHASEIQANELLILTKSSK